MTTRPPGPPAAAMRPARRRALAAGAGAALAVVSRRAVADAAELRAAIAAYTGGARVTRGRVRLDIAPLVENGNAVPMTVTVDAPPGRVRVIAVFNELNPQREVIAARLGPRAGRPELATRIRLATSQRLVALAQTDDGAWWSGDAEVVVTLAACVE